MSKTQVAFLLGTPAIHDPFHQDRWDYISMFSRRGNEQARRLVTLTFKDDVLVATDGIGDSAGGDIKALEDTKAAVANIDDIATARETVLVTEDGVIHWTVQLGAFSTHAKAAELAGEADRNGYPAVIEERVVPGLGTRFQVRSGQFDTFNDAQAALGGMEDDLDVAAFTVPIKALNNDG
jgi:hypothetical protein